MVVESSVVFHARGSKFLEMSRADGYSASQESHPIGKGSAGQNGVVAQRHQGQIMSNTEVVSWQTITNEKQVFGCSLSPRGQVLFAPFQVITHVQKHCILEVVPETTKSVSNVADLIIRKPVQSTFIRKKPWKIWGQNLNKKWEK